MREIKFRCWIKPYYKFDKCKKDYRMIYPHLEKDEWYVIDCQSQTLMDGEGGKISDYKMYLQQFTGLKDKNGKDIYEGDVCIYKTGEKKGGVYSEETVFKGFVRYDEARFEIGSHNGYGGEWEDLSMLIGHYHKIAKEFEVIGNIFENPELIK